MHRVWSFAALLSLPSVALAADADLFDPSGSLAHATGGLLAETPTLTAQGVSAGLLANIAEDLVVVRFADGTQDPVLASTLATTLYGAYTLEDVVRVELFLPAYGYVDAPGTPFSGAAFGDIRLQALFPLATPSEAFSFGVMPRIGLPTGMADAMVRQGASFGLNFVAGGELTGPAIGWAANAAVNLSSADAIGDVAVGSNVTLTGSSWVHVDDALRVGADLQGIIGLVMPADKRQHGLFTGDVFAQLANATGVGMTVGVGTGMGVGAPEYRMFAALTYAPLFSDADGDGFGDDDDNCPTAPEDVDGFEDMDGCPDADNDSDRILDLDDSCPNQAEDYDDWQDDDGCPDADNDDDGLIDADDACPNLAGDPALAGCPDTDGDGLTDNVDACPDQRGPENTQGCPDRDGDRIPDADDECPDEAVPPDTQLDSSNGCPTRVYVADGQIRILEQIQFDTGRATIKSGSDDLMTEIARILVDNPQVTSVEVSGHTDDRGSASRNQRLSQSRADAVRQWLIDHDVAEDRLTAKGYGPDQPIDTNRTTAGRANNRRVAFTILAQEPLTHEVPAPVEDDALPTNAPDEPEPVSPPVSPRVTPDDGPTGVPASPWSSEDTPDAPDTAPVGVPASAGTPDATPDDGPTGVPATATPPAPEAPAETPPPAPTPRPSGNPWGPR